MVFAQTAALLPNARQQYFDGQGNVLSGGSVGYYVPGSTTLKQIWLDSGESTPAQNPVTLDENGYPEQTGQTYGDGSYRQIVKDVNGVTIWDNTTSSTGSGGGGGGSPTVGDGDAVGTIKPYGGFIAPYGYVFAYGQALTRTGFPEAFASLTNQQNVNCVSGSATLTGLTDTTQLATGTPVESLCLNPGTTIISTTTSTVTVSSVAIISGTTTARFFPFGNGDGNLTFNVPDLRGRSLAGRDNMGGIAANRLTSAYFGTSADALGANGGDQSHILLPANLPPYTPSGTIANGAITSTVNSAATIQVLDRGVGGTGNWSSGGFNTPTASSVIGVTSSQAASTFTGNAQGGTSTPVSTVMPTQTSNYIIKVIPDSNPNSFFGVASIGGMYGVINCGDGITCSGNTISATTPSPEAGGANGQIQFNNSGLLGGFTMIGDCTTSVPNITCTKTNGTPFAPSATVDTTNANNITSGNLSIPRLNNGINANSTTVWRGDGVWSNSVGNGTSAFDILGTLNITPQANSLLQGFGVIQSGTGTLPPSTRFDFNSIVVSSDDIATDGGDDTTSAFKLSHTYGGSNSKGAKESFRVDSRFTATTSASNTNRNYVAGRFDARASAPDTGTSGNPQGALFALNPVAQLSAGATNWLELNGGEIDVGMEAGASTARRLGWSIVSYGVGQGAFDTALNIGSFTGGVSWGSGITFSNGNGGSPVDTGGSLILADAPLGTWTVANGIELSAANITGNLIRGKGLVTMLGSTSGSVALAVQPTAGSYTFNLPTNAGTAGQPLLSGGGGSTAMTFGTLGVAAGGTGDTGTAWTAYSTTIGCVGGGSIAVSSAPAFYKSLGKTTNVRINLNLSSISCATALTVTLPFLSNATNYQTFAASNPSINNSLNANVAPSSNVVTVTSYNNTGPGASGTNIVSIQGPYETQ